MGAVYEATHRNGRRAAIKILHARYATDENIRKRFLREGYVANKIDHPGAVAILDDDLGADESPFLVMELTRGGVALGEALEEDGWLPGRRRDARDRGTAARRPWRGARAGDRAP